MSEPFDVHLVSHTHWDREWYHPAPRFRQRLVALVDTLLDGAANASDTADAGFLLDGQAVVLEDYLAVRPERAPELASSLRDGRLEAGPWYVLADELIPSAESLVRNLLAGGRVLRTLGASAPQVLYSPDAFGHPAALPTLAAGFGLPLIIAWRGYGGRRWPEGDAVRWRSAAGDEALLVHLPPDGYEFGSSLPTDDDGASARWQRLRDVLVPRARLGILLVQNGADHHAPQRGLRLAVAALARAAHPDRLHASSLSAFAREASERAARLDQPLPAVEGELRDSYGYTWTLAGTLGSRAAQKRHAAAVERLLLREAEPWAALARLATGGSASFRLHLAAAWKTLLRCHPHDTLCGCSSDEVARAMDARLESARTQAIGVRDDALLALVRHDPEEARERRSDWRAALLLANAAPRARGGLAEVEVLTFIRDEPVGPGSARLGNGATRSGGEEPPPLVPPGTVMQELSRERRFERTESPRHYPDNDLVDARRYLAWVDTVPGGTVVPVELAERAGAPRNGPPSPARAAGREVANDRLTVRLMGDRVSLAAGGAAELRDVLGFESRADHGDLYTPSLRGERVSRGIQDGSVTSRGPLRAELECRWTLTVPTNPAPPAAGGDAYPDRLAPVIAGRAALIVDAGASFLRIHIRGENTARDHRLRVRLSTGVARPDVWADAAFGPVRRAPLDVPPEDQVAETPPPTAPLHRYVSCYGASSGATVFSDGLAEYEVTEQGDVYVTLVRAVGELSRGDLPERPGHAGWPMATPEAQCLGPFEAKLALMLHGPRSAQTMALVERTADDVLLPLRGTTLRSAYGELTPAGGLELVGDGLTFSTCKESEDGAWTVLRCTNVTEHPVKGAWHLGLPITEARLARLDETPLQELAVNDGVVRFPARARDVVTVLVR